MKTIALLFTLISTPLFAADTITVVSPAEVLRNGVNVGNVVSFAATNPQFASELQAGLNAWARAQQIAVNEATAARNVADEKLKVLIEGAKKALEKKTSEERMAAAVALLQTVEQSEAEKRAAEIDATIARLAAEKAALAK